MKATGSLEAFLRAHRALIARLHRDAGADRWDVLEERFGEALHRSLTRGWRPEGGAETELVSQVRYLSALHAEDLALACACIDGHDGAWEEFIARLRPQLHAAARAIAGDSAARDLADSLYADLYGLGERDGKRRSLLEYFHGRSRLSTWLRAILAQRHVDALRAAAKTRPIEELAVEPEASSGADGPLVRQSVGSAHHNPAIDPARHRNLALLQMAVRTALESLDPAERFRLACYYVQELTLVEIGRLTGEHEATVSRKLARTRRDLRMQVEDRLRATHGLQEAEIADCFACALGEWPFDLTSALGKNTR